MTLTLEIKPEVQGELASQAAARGMDVLAYAAALLEQAIHLPNKKLVEAKRQRFTAEGKRERIAKSLSALNQPPSIRLTADEWRQIVEDPDLEDQFS